MNHKEMTSKSPQLSNNQEILSPSLSGQYYISQQSKLDLLADAWNQFEEICNKYRKQYNSYHRGMTIDYTWGVIFNLCNIVHIKPNRSVF